MPGLPDGTRRAFRLALRRPRIETDVEDEVSFHLEMRVAELVARGWSPDAARAEALRRFGDRHHWSMAMTEVDRERATNEQLVARVVRLAGELERPVASPTEARAILGISG